MKKILITLFSAFALNVGLAGLGGLGTSISPNFGQFGMSTAQAQVVQGNYSNGVYASCENPDVPNTAGQAADAGGGSRAISEKRLKSDMTCADFLSDYSKTRNDQGQCDSTCLERNSQVFNPVELDRLQTVACGTGYSGTKVQRSTRLNNGTYSSWADIDTSACVCEPTTENQAGACPSGYTGARIYQRSWTCTGNSGLWGAFSEVSNTCAAPLPPCVPQTPQTQVISCVAPNTGTMTQTNTSVCAAQTGSPTWTGWVTTTNNCVAPPSDLTISWITRNRTYKADAFDAGIIEVRNLSSTQNTVGTISFSFDLKEPSGITDYNQQETLVVNTANGQAYSVANMYFTFNRTGTVITFTSQGNVAIPPNGQVYVAFKLKATELVQKTVDAVAILTPTAGGQVNTTNDTDLTKIILDGGKLCEVLPNESQTLACQSGYLGGIQQHRTSSCPARIGDPVWSDWLTDSNTCAPICTPGASQNQTLACPTGQVGEIKQTRASVCAGPTGMPTWGAWTTTSNSCYTPCAVQAPQNQTLACPAGQTGAITQTRTSFCASPQSTLQWNAWSTVSNTCQTICAPGASETVYQACPNNEVGETYIRRDSYCPAYTGAPAWGGWYYVHYNCQPRCQSVGSQQQWVGCPAYHTGGILQQNDSYCPAATGGYVWTGWYTISYQCTPMPNPVGATRIQSYANTLSPYRNYGQRQQITGDTRSFLFARSVRLVTCPAPYQAEDQGSGNYACYLQ